MYYVILTTEDAMQAITKLVLTVVDKVSPIHGEKRGRVIKAAYPNDKGLRGAPSFKAPYLVAEGDATSKADALRFVKALQAQGFYF